MHFYTEQDVVQDEQTFVETNSRMGIETDKIIEISACTELTIHEMRSI